MTQAAALGPFLSEEDLAVLVTAAGRRQPLWTEAELERLIRWAEKTLLDQVLLELVLKGAADVIWDGVRNEPVFFPVETGPAKQERGVT